MSVSTYNLARNSRVVFTTNLDTATKQISTANFTTSNAQEITVLDGFSFSQTTNADTVTITEAGVAPTRGQRSFNTQLNPVDFSFSTYIRPYIASNLVECEESVLWNALFSDYAIAQTGASVAIGTATGATFTAATATSAARISITGTALTPTIATTASATTLVIGEVVTIKGAIAAGANHCNVPVRIVTASASAIVAEFLVEPAVTPVTGNFNTTGITLERTGWVKNAAVAADTGTAGVTVAYSDVNIGRSNVNQLLPFGMIMTVDNVTYLIDNCVMDQATIDFGLDGIATVQWTGKGTTLRQLTSTVNYSTATNPVLSSGLSGTISGRASASTVKYITNKLSTVSLTSNLYGASGTSYNVPLTGGSLTIANNVNYITPANIGVVNSPVTYYTGTRAITGTLNAYLRTGTSAGVANVAGLLNTMLTAATASVEPKYALTISIGGSSNAVRMDAQINGAALQIPTVDAQAVLSTAINFTAQGTDDYRTNQNYNLEIPNELRIRYFSN